MSLGLKLYYMRTRAKKVTQTQMAKDLEIRQATISNIEQGISQPSLPLLKTLCRYFDVTPTYLLDEEGPVRPGPAERWTNRHGLISSGHYVEVPANTVHKLTPNTCLVALLPSTPIYDEEAMQQRVNGTTEDLVGAYRIEQTRRRSEAEQLRHELDSERRASRLRRRGLKHEAES